MNVCGMVANTSSCQSICRRATAGIDASLAHQFTNDQ
jgi:hypothetical protein